LLKFESSSIGIKPVGTQIPVSFDLKQNYPNPFNPVTTIEFDIPKSGYITLSVYDITGREVSIPVNEFLNAGIYRIRFDASNGVLSSGTYFYRLSASDYVKTNKMILTK